METPGRTVQRSALLLLSIGMGLVGVCMMFHEEIPSQTTVPPLIAHINPNTASVGELLSLPGIGPATASAILSYREQHGDFATVEELLEVRGIGEAKLEALAGLESKTEIVQAVEQEVSYSVYVNEAKGIVDQMAKDRLIGR